MFSGKIALGIVSVTVELNMKFLENVTKSRRGPRTEPSGTPLEMGEEPNLGS